jgi:hypothetical protein
VKGSSKTKRRKKKGREEMFESINSLASDERGKAIEALAPKMREIFERWRKNNGN